MSASTPYTDVNSALDDLLVSVRFVLGLHLTGLYLNGSLALGDFDPGTSDLDVVIVTSDELLEEQLKALQAMHARIAERDSPWAVELEASYIPARALRRIGSTSGHYPRVERGSGELHLQPHDSEWIIQRHTLREHGIAMSGPLPGTLIDPVTPDELRQALVRLMRIWWTPMLGDPFRLYHRGYHTYAVLTMCRVLYTLEYGAVVSKPAAGRWALEVMGGHWEAPIQRALLWRKTEDNQVPVPAEEVDAVLGLIGYTSERCKVFETRRA